MGSDSGEGGSCSIQGEITQGVWILLLIFRPTSVASKVLSMRGGSDLRGSGRSGLTALAALSICYNLQITITTTNACQINAVENMHGSVKVPMGGWGLATLATVCSARIICCNLRMTTNATQVWRIDTARNKNISRFFQRSINNDKQIYMLMCWRFRLIYFCMSKLPQYTFLEKL